MSIKVIESQGSKAYLVAAGTDLSTVAKIVTALGTAKEIGDINTIGDVTSSRNVTEYKVIDKDEVAKSLGSLSLGNLPIELMYNGEDTAGQDDLRDAYSTNTRRELIIKLNDEPTTGSVKNPTYITMQVGVSSDGVAIAIDQAVIYKTTLEITSKPVLIPAAITTP